MYEAYYGLAEKPFSILPDPEFLFWSRAHSMAYAMMEYGVMNQAGFTVITGDVGCGKTTLIRRLLGRIGNSVAVGLLSNTGESSTDLLRWILMSLDQPFDATNYVSLFKQFQTYLIEEYSRNRRVVLIIDEAQNLGARELEELRMLSNINAEKDQLLQLIIVGQPQLRDLLQAPELKQFAQRVSSDFHLGRLRAEDVVKYIDHRLHIAGAGSVVFSDEACHLVFQASGGVPRVINILCDTALIYGFANEVTSIDGEIVRNVIKDKREFGVLSFDGDTSLGRRPRPQLLKY